MVACKCATSTLVTSIGFSDENSGRVCGGVPIQDQQFALCLLLELAVQRGTLNGFLESILLLLHLSEKGKLEGAPLIPLLKRFQAMNVDVSDRYNDIPSAQVDSCNVVFFWNQSYSIYVTSIAATNLYVTYFRQILLRYFLASAKCLIIMSY